MSYSYKPKYISPRGPGRPPQRVGQELVVDDFWAGINTYFDSVTIPESCRLSFNSRCLQGKTLNRRMGYLPFPEEGDAGDVYALMCLHQAASGQDIFLRLVDGAGAGVQLQKYDWDLESWVNIGGNIGDADSRIDWDWTYFWGKDDPTDYGEDRVYFCNGVDDLMYTNGSIVSSVPGIKFRYIATKEASLVGGHVTEVHQPNCFIWSELATHQFYKDNEDYAESSNKVVVDGPITKIGVFGSLIYAFTASEGLFETDITNVPSPRKISTHGTMSPKSVVVGEEVMIWADQHGVHQLPLGGSVQKISLSIDNMYTNIGAANYFQMVGGVTSKRTYELHVGNLTFEGETHENLVFVYEIEQSRLNGRNIWRLDKGKPFPNCFLTIADTFGFLHTYYGARGTQTVYQSDAGADDNGGEIVVEWVSRDFPLMSENREFTADEMFLRYEPLGIDEIPISLYARTDTESWRLVGNYNLPVGSGPVRIVRFGGLKGLTGRTLGIKLEFPGNLPISIKQVLVNYGYNDSQLTNLVPITV